MIGFEIVVGLAFLGVFSRQLRGWWPLLRNPVTAPKSWAYPGPPDHHSCRSPAP
jgi:hypothetical protein